VIEVKTTNQQNGLFGFTNCDHNITIIIATEGWIAVMHDQDLPFPLWKGKAKTGPTPNVVFVVVSHYQRLQIIVLLLQAGFGDCCTLLQQQLQWLQQDRRSRLFASLFSCCLKTDSVASCLREKKRCFLNSVPVQKTVWVSAFSIQVVVVACVW